MMPDERPEPEKRPEPERTPATNALPIDLSPEEARDLLSVLADRFEQAGLDTWAKNIAGVALQFRPEAIREFAEIITNSVVRAIALAAVRRNEWRLIHEAYRDQYRCHVCGERSFAALGDLINGEPLVFCGAHAAERGCRLSQ